MEVAEGRRAQIRGRGEGRTRIERLLDDRAGKTERGGGQVL